MKYVQIMACGKFNPIKTNYSMWQISFDEHGKTINHFK
jgi:hypothetical protein